VKTRRRNDLLAAAALGKRAGVIPVANLHGAAGGAESGVGVALVTCPRLSAPRSERHAARVGIGGGLLPSRVEEPLHGEGAEADEAAEFGERDGAIQVSFNVGADSGRWTVIRRSLGLHRLQGRKPAAAGFACIAEEAALERRGRRLVQLGRQKTPVVDTA